MKKNRKQSAGKLRALSIIMAFGMLTTGCGAGNKSEMATAEAYDTGSSYMSNDVYSYDMAETTEMAVEEETTAGEAADGAETPEVQDTARKLIKNVDMEVETETFDELLQTLNDKTAKLGGYIEASYTYNGSSYYGNDNRNASLTIRIPAQQLDEFLSAMAEVSNIISKNESVSDVTLQYVDMESHKKALQAEQDRLLELLEQAETIEDIITLESRLSEVRYQIESMESQLRTMDNQVSYSTVYLNIQEVTKLTPVKEQSIGEKIVTGFTGNLYDVGKGLLNFGIGIIISLPYLLVWAVVITIIVFIIRAFVKRSKKKKQKAGEAQRQAQNPQQIKPAETEDRK